MKVQAAPSFFESLKKIDSLEDKYYRVRGWIKYHFTKDFWKIIITAFKGYPWQENFLYELEKAKINEMMNYQKKSNRFVNVEYVIRDMQICINLIDIFNGDDTRYFHYDGGLQFVPIKDSDNIEVKTDKLVYHCDIKVNTKNVDKFVNDDKIKKYFIEHPHELYILKAKKLYHKIRYEHDAEWWD